MMRRQSEYLEFGHVEWRNHEQSQSNHDQRRHVGEECQDGNSNTSSGYGKTDEVSLGWMNIESS